MGKKDKAEKAKEDQRGKTARQDYQVVQSTLTWKIVQESAPFLKAIDLFKDRKPAFTGTITKAPKKGNPDDNATCQDFVKASGKEVTWVTEKDLEGMEETYKSLPKEEKKKMNFERPKKKDLLEKSEVFALKSKNLLLWKFFKGENPGDSRSFLHERFNAYLGELNDCAKRKAG